MRSASVVPYERRAFESPIVPNFVMTDIVVGEERKVASIEAALGKKMPQRTLRRLLKKTAGVGNASGASHPSAPRKRK